MKISKWEELDDLKNDKYQVRKYCGFIAVRTITESIDVVDIYCDITPKDKILAILKLFGFDIEFEEQPKLSKREYHFVNYLPEDWWMARDADKAIYIYNAEPKNGSNGIGTPVFWQEMLLDGRLFPFITPDRAWSVKELRELEHE